MRLVCIILGCVIMRLGWEDGLVLTLGVLASLLLRGVDGLNLYVYVRNNPVNGVDELGYSTDSIHLDINGKEIARYEDGDDNTYQHDDIDLSQQHIDGAKSVLSTAFDLNEDTSRGGKKLTYYSGDNNVVEGKGLVPITIIGAETVDDVDRLKYSHLYKK